MTQSATAEIICFPPRAAHCIRIIPESAGGWLVIAREHGWLYGNRRDARADAAWLSTNLRLPVRKEDRNRERIAS
jgi:hypothetical protein